MNQTRHNINIIKSIIRQPFCWPGGYERAAIANDGGCLCHKCLKQEYYTILHSTKYNYRDGWQVIGQFNASELDEPILCDHCSNKIS